MLVALILSGVVSHGGWSEHSAEASAAHMAVMADHVHQAPHTSAAHHVMTPACTVACIGTTAPDLWRPDLFEAEFAAVRLWSGASQAPAGRVTAPDERPPISV
jgi:hypothetical protein